MWPFGKSTEDRLKEVLNGYPALEGETYQVAVKGKTVRYSGSVSSGRHKNLLVAAATGLSGVDEVDASGLEVQGNGGQIAAKGRQVGSLGRQVGAKERQIGAKATSKEVDPAALALAVAKSIKAHPNLADNPIDVWQVGTQVKLRGAVDSQAEHEAAVALAEAVAGRGNVDSSSLRLVANVKQLSKKNPAGEVVYEVQAGDTLSAIALKYYGSASRDAYMRIATHNGIDNPDLIRVGQQLVIPGSLDGPDTTLS